MTHFYQTMKISTPEDVFRLVAFLFAILWVVGAIKARQNRSPNTGTAFISPEHSLPHFWSAYDKRRHQKNSFARYVEISQIAVIFFAGAALTAALGFDVYDRLNEHRLYLGSPENLFRVGFLCGAIYLISFSLREFFALRHR